MEDQELIRKYIRNQCSDDELKQVDERLASDTEFSNLFEEEKVITKGIGLAERERLKQMLKSEGSNKKTYWYAAAAVVPLLIVSYFFISTDADYQQLYLDNYETYGVYEFGQERGGNESDSLEISTFRAYQSGNFQQALMGLERLYDESQEDGYLFYQAICLIELERVDEVINKLDKISEGSTYYQIAQWYKALTLLKREEIEACKEILMALSRESNGLGNQATQLLEEL